ncbi:MFS general substrate transporter [Zopfia rhizophila CBS 207.26]|uniref:MFS general substrate transporter n=1 Tax=Zopfia rhizophila CBS 207.26 TaxID=1314779 RepID=A0A6A6EST1_9PEZI|nr:MFS general substrate transporter [Zopfia rhizophila CBS 207.26]
MGKYQDLLAEQESTPDRVFIGGHTFQELDSNLVVLNENANEHPRTWKFGKKACATALVGAFCFLSPFASTIFAPSVSLVMDELDIRDSTLGALQVSIFLFAYAIGPLFLAPLSEMYGRTIILHTGNFVLVAFSIGGGFAQTPAQLSVCRFCAGLGGSSGLAVVGGVTADIWDLETRPKASGLVMLGPVLGPILGPVCGGWMSELASWRWTLWVPAITSGFISVVGLLCLPESYAPRLVEKKLRRVRASRPNDDLYTVLDLIPRSTGTGFLFSQFVRPVVYLIIDPALLSASIFYSVAFGVIYLIVVTYSDVFGLGYHHSVGIVGTDFLAMGVGMIIGTVGTIKSMEAIFKKDSPNGQKKFKPESRLLSAVPGVVLTTGGLFMYGFSASRAHFIVPLIGLAIFATGGMNIMMAIQLYAIEGFKFPASAFAAISVLRCLFAGAFPLFGSKLFKTLGIDWGAALLAFLVLGIGLPFVLLLYISGSRLRQLGASRMAKFEGTKY